VSALQWRPQIDTGATLAGNEVTLPPNSFALWVAES
jgi:hypothetical protein